METVLLHAGYEIAVAFNGDEASEIAAKLGMVDLLLTDERMPGMLVSLLLDGRIART